MVTVTGRFPRDGFTDFVGRQVELACVAGLLDRSRLVSVVGPGGVGKTRLALVAAAQAVDSYPHGVWIVELSGLRDPLLLPNTVASVLQLAEHDARTPMDTVLEYLRDRRLLLILDTCEHMLDACASFIQAVLAEAPMVTVLATSRQPLDTPGEVTYPVPPLPVPDDDSADLPDLRGIGHADAVELFALRAVAAQPSFALTAANSADVVSLCRRLDGIPLAIELAAVQLRALPLVELTQRLGKRFAVLTDASPGAVPRHQTLRTAIEWSHELCSPSEQRLWARLSVFAGHFYLADVEEVCAETELERDEVIAALFGLVDKSVVLRDGHQYRLLDTLREFGAERLAANGDEELCKARHIRRYERQARYFGEHFADDDQLERYRELRRVHANVRTALEYALDGPTGYGTCERSGAELACQLYGYWQISGLLAEGGYWLTRVLDRFPDGPERARALVNRGFLRSFAGQLDGALADCEAGIALALSLGLDDVSARGYQHLHLTLTQLGRHEEADAAGAEARKRLVACGDRPGELMLVAQLGHTHHLSGRFDECVDTCAEGLTLLGADSREEWIKTYLNVVCGFALFQIPGREAECTAVLSESLEGKLRLGDTIGIAFALEGLAWIAAKTGAQERAAWLLGAADPLWVRGGTRLAGTAILEEFHQQAAKRSAAVLGSDRYTELRAAGAGHVLGQLRATGVGEAIALELP
jgi:non-specific serine/threonine protein kinase